MLSIILGILKVIGIILLIVLGLVLLILAIVLFVPIRYQGIGEITDEKKEAHIKVTWLLHAIRIKVDYGYPDNPQISVKALWIDVMKLLEKKKSKSQSADTADSEATELTETVDGTQAVDDTQTVAERIEADTETDTEEADALDEKDEAGVEANAKDTVGDVAVEDAAEAEKTKETLREKIDKIVFKITSVYDKIKSILGNIKYYWDVLNEEDTKGLIAHAFEALFKILKSIRPRKLRVTAEFGFDTPDTTGQLYGLYWSFKPALGEHVELTPNFEEKVLVGDLYFKGRITIFVILINGLKILFDKRLKPLFDKLKNGGKQNG